jgi:predicted transcriptional regulator
MTFKEYKKAAFEQDSALKAEYNALAPQYELIKEVIAARIEQNISQTELARRAGTKQSNISRFESGNYNPSLAFLVKIAEALGKELSVSIQ